MHEYNHVNLPKNDQIKLILEISYVWRITDNVSLYAIFCSSIWLLQKVHFIKEKWHTYVQKPKIQCYLNYRHNYFVLYIHSPFP
jgi:hypothetical protein